MSERLLSFDPLTGLSSHFSYDELTDTTTIRTSGDSTPYLERNKALANDTEFSKSGIKDGMWLYACFPPAVQVELLLNHGIDIYKREHGARLSEILEDPQYKYLKTTVGHHKFG